MIRPIPAPSRRCHPVRRAARAAVAFATASLLVCAQTAPVTSPSVAPAQGKSDPIVELSVFEVRSDKDVGYQAGNTVSGSRLDSRLKDTPAAISAFTPEFLADIAATNLQEMLGYATNIETEVSDFAAGFDSNAQRDATGNDYQFRIRGLPAGAARDFVESAAPVDLYNVERAEVASGPNSILFGLGSAGGLVALTGKQARLGRDRTTLKEKLPPLPANRQPVFRPAYPPSKAIVGVTFDDATARSEAPGNRDGWMSIYDAPEPWGPWTHVHTEFNPDRWGAYTIIFTFVNKWLSADGRDFVIVHTKDDRWATIEGRFKLARD